MKDSFEKNIQSLFEQPPELPFDEGAWLSLESRLEGGKTKRKFGLWFWLPLIFGAASAVFALGYSFAKSNMLASAKQVPEVVALKTDVSNTKPKTPVKEIVVIHDTIVQTIIKYTAVPQEKSTLSYPLISPLLGASLHRKDLLSPMGGKFSILEQSRVRAKQDVADQDESGVVPSVMMQSVGSISPQLIHPTAKRAELPLSPVFRDYQRKSASYYFRKLIPNDINLTIYDAGFSNLNFKSTAGTQNNSLYGVRARLGYWRKWSLVLGLEALKSTFDIYADRAGSADIFANLPTVNPTTPGDMLHEVVGEFRYLQIPFGLQCDLPIKGSFEAFVGAGLTFQKNRTSILTYDYFSTAAEYGIEKGNLIPPTFNLNSYWFDTGLRFYVGSRWSLEAGVGGQFSLKNKLFKHESLNYLKGHLGLGFDF